MKLLRMIVLATAAATATCSVPAHADDDSEYKRRVCPQVESLAETVIKAKQAGVSYSRVIEITYEVSADNQTPTVGKLTREMVSDAYSLPDYSTPHYKNQQRIEFARKWSRMCWGAD